MKRGEPWMRKEHPRTGVAHHDPDFFPHFRLIAVYGAFRAYGFLRTEMAMLNALRSIREKD